MSEVLDFESQEKVFQNMAGYNQGMQTIVQDHIYLQKQNGILVRRFVEVLQPETSATGHFIIFFIAQTGSELDFYSFLIKKVSFMSEVVHFESQEKKFQEVAGHYQGMQELIWEYSYPQKQPRRSFDVSLGLYTGKGALLVIYQ